MSALIRDLTLVRYEGDPNDYRIGFLDSADPARPHHVVLTMLPRDNTRHAAAVCTDLIRTFVGVRCVIMTGIAGGVPAPGRPDRHVRLGDVVVADGLVDYGHVALVDGQRRLRRFVDGVSMDLVRAARELQMHSYQGIEADWARWFTPATSLPMARYARPPEDTDRLLIGGVPVPHPPSETSGHVPGLPKVHHGAVGCADVLLRDERHRDELAAEHGILAVEMEGTGVASGATLHGINWFMVRGIADYCENVGKSDRWHGYASLSAAAYVRALLEVCRPFTAWRANPGSGVMALLSDHDADRLIGLLSDLPELDLRALWRASAGPLVPEPPDPPRSAVDLFAHLVRMNAGPDGLPPALALVEALAGRVPGPRADQLRDWVDQVATLLRLTGPLAEYRQRMAGTAAPDPGTGQRPCLIVQVVLDAIDAQKCVVSQWLQHRDGPWRPEPLDEPRTTTVDGLEGLVQQAVRRAEGAWRESSGRMAIEFVLPTELLPLDVEWWRTELDSPVPSPLCLDYSVVVRSLDRMHADHRRRVWRNRWDALWSEPAGHRVHWGRSVGEAPDVRVWDAMLRGDAGLTCVVLGAPPTEPDGLTELHLALRAGVPVIVWDRRTPLPHETVGLIRSMSAGHPYRLVEEVTRLRTTAAVLGDGDRRTHPGRHLALLWDDPYRSIEPRRPQP